MKTTTFLKSNPFPAKRIISHASSFCTHTMSQSSLGVLVKTVKLDLKLFLQNPSNDSSLCLLIRELNTKLLGQAQLPDIFESEMQELILSTWNSHSASKQLVDTILEFIRTVSDAFVDEMGQFSSGYTCGIIQSNQLVVDFYYQMFGDSFCNTKPPLVQLENQKIGRDFVCLLERYPELLNSWFLRPRLFVPMDFFLDNFEVFPHEVAQCFHFSQQFPASEDMDERCRVMLMKTAWNSAEEHEILSSYWKIQFFEELMLLENVPNHYTEYLHQFLLLVKECKSLFCVCFCLLETFDSKAVEMEVVAVLEHRLLLLSPQLPVGTIEEFDLLGIMTNVAKLFDINNYFVTRNLLYKDDTLLKDFESLQFFHDKVEQYLYNLPRFVAKEEDYYEKLRNQNDDVIPQSIQLDYQKAIPLLLLKSLRSFFLNSCLVNKCLTICISELVVFEFLHSSSVSVDIFSSLREVIESLDMEAFRNCLLAGKDGIDLNDPYNWVGAKQNIDLFERIIAFSHAVLRSKKKYREMNQ